MLDEAEWEQREVQLVSCIKKNEEEKESLEKEKKDELKRVNNL